VTRVRWTPVALVVAALQMVACFAKDIEVRAPRVDAATQPESAVRPEPTARMALLDDVAQALLSGGPDHGRAGDLALYGRFIGAWDVEVTAYPPGGAPVRQHGEWLFSWALEGRAVQDVWIVPARAHRVRITEGPRPYGTTLRFPDASGQRWRIVWINPASHSVVTMTARAVDGEIVQEGIDADGQRFRWVFHEIEPNRFRWRAEDTADGVNWTIRQEMRVTRRTGVLKSSEGAES
jgi:hypothetical protein